MRALPQADRQIPVLHFLNRFGIGGAERQFVERLRLHPSGFRPLVACFDAEGPLLPQVRALGFTPEVFPLKGSLAQANTAAQVVRLAAYIRKHQIELVHATDWTTNFVGLLAARLAGAKIAVSRLDLGHLRGGFGRYHRRLEMICAASADLVIANADAVRDLCLSTEGCSPDRVAVVRNGLDVARFDRLSATLAAPLPDFPPGSKVIAVIGNLWPVKGHRTLVEAAATVCARFPEVHFVCAGEGPEREFLTARIARLGLTGRVHLLGHRMDVPAVLKRASGATLCSSAEGLSNALMEAMAASLPIVATAVGGSPELVRPGENGWLVPPGDAAKLAEALCALVSDPARAASFGQRGRARIEAELTLERMAEAHGDAYRQALGLPTAKAPGSLRAA